MPEPDTPREPSYPVYPPDEIIHLAALVEPKVVLNRRPIHWSEELKAEFLADAEWRERVLLHYGRLMFPPLTEFLSRDNLNKTKVLICCQDAKGGISTIIDTLLEVYWTGERKKTGVLTSLWLESPHYFGAPHGSIWGSYVLAIAQVRYSAPVWNKRDPLGTHFVELFKQFCGY